MALSAWHEPRHSCLVMLPESCWCFWSPRAIIQASWLHLHWIRLSAFQLSSLRSLIICRLYKKQDACCLRMLILSGNLSQQRTPCLLCLMQSIGGYYRQFNKNFSLGVWTEFPNEWDKPNQCSWSKLGWTGLGANWWQRCSNRWPHPAKPFCDAKHIQHVGRFVMGKGAGWRGR